MSADAKALRLFGVARDSIEASAVGQPEPEPEPEPQLERPPCARRILDPNDPIGRLATFVLALATTLGIFLTLYILDRLRIAYNESLGSRTI